MARFSLLFRYPFQGGVLVSKGQFKEMNGCEASSTFELALFLREGRGIVWLAAMVNAGGWQRLMAVRVEAGHTMAGPGRDARHAQPGAGLDPHCCAHHPYPPPSTRSATLTDGYQNACQNATFLEPVRNRDGSQI